jgi:hypothetical protein
MVAGFGARGQAGPNAGPRFAAITPGSEFCNQQIVTAALYARGIEDS